MKRRLLALFLLALVVFAAWLARELHIPFRGYADEVFIDVLPGTRVTSVVAELQAHGVLARRAPLLAWYLLLRPRYSFKAGEYLFNRPLRPWDVYWKLVRGEVYYHPVTIPEGLDLFAVARTVASQLPLSEADILKAGREVSLVTDLDREASTLEGYLFPDTYLFARASTPRAVAHAMVRRFRRVFEKALKPGLASSDLSLHQIVTLASLVEKETPLPEERQLVAGVFLNRLRQGLPLQCDPTVIYAARLRGRYVGVIRQSDLQFDSPYNTYRYRGLPPGPICNPGLASLKAALEPAGTDYVYFVSNSQGGHVFSRTLKEHQRAVTRYRRQQAAEARARPTVGPLLGCDVTGKASASRNSRASFEPRREKRQK